MDQLLDFLASDGAIDERLADQLRTSKVTQHQLTNAEVLRTCLAIDVQIMGDLGKPGLIEMTGTNPSSAPAPSHLGVP